jgi:hypothetical protein
VSQDFLEAALRYAHAGRAVFPLRPRGKIPITEHGSHDATTDEALIRDWWARWPDANIGMVLTDLVVVDIDPRNGGDPDALPGALTDTCYARTGGGGLHYLYKSLNGARYAAHPAPGVDVKSGAGAYIVVEPSVHPSGECYCWLDESEPWSMAPTEAPAWLVQREAPKSNGGAEGQIPAGQRNATLASMAGAMRRRGMSADAILAALLAENAKCSPPLPEDEVRRTAASVARYTPEAPAQPQPEAPRETRLPLDWPKLSGLEPPARRWALKGWFGFGHTTLLVGAGGIGKTLLGQQIGSCLAIGRDFVDTVPAALKVLMWACEDDHDELWRRQIAIAKWLNVGLETFAENLVIVPRHGMDNALAATDFGRPILTPALDELAQQAGDLRADVVILDNAAQVYGAGENDRHAVTMFLNALPGRMPGRAIMLFAHPARSTGSEFSGSSAWENTARTRLYLGTRLPDEKPDTDEPPDETVRYLARRKANYSNRDWRKFTYTEGVLIPEAIEPSGGIVSEIRERNSERTVLDGLRKLSDLGLHPTDSSNTGRYLPKLIGEYKLAEGNSAKELAEAMRRLILSGKLVRGEVGRSARRQPIEGIKEVD